MKPSEWHIGVIDLFAILLPGAAATALLKGMGGDALIGVFLPSGLSDATLWIGFLFLAFALGHLVFLLAAQMDWMIYGPLRHRFIARDPALLLAERLRDEAFAREREALRGMGVDAPPMNAFAFSKAVLTREVPAAAADVSRYEADSKFFRSLTLVLAAAAVAAGGWSGAALALACVASFWRYVERRLKSTCWAYRHLVALAAARPQALTRARHGAKASGG